MIKSGRIKTDIDIKNNPKCMLGKEKRRNWRYKPSTRSNYKDKFMNQKFPGQTVAVDQLESSVPGLIAQMSGNPTYSRYRVATVFVDLYSRYVFVNFQMTTKA